MEEKKKFLTIKEITYVMYYTIRISYFNEMKSITLKHRIIPHFVFKKMVKAYMCIYLRNIFEFALTFMQFKI